MPKLYQWDRWHTDDLKVTVEWMRHICQTDRCRALWRFLKYIFLKEPAYLFYVKSWKNSLPVYLKAFSSCFSFLLFKFSVMYVRPLLFFYIRTEQWCQEENLHLKEKPLKRQLHRCWCSELHCFCSSLYKSHFPSK